MLQLRTEAVWWALLGTIGFLVGVGLLTGIIDGKTPVFAGTLSLVFAALAGWNAYNNFSMPLEQLRKHMTEDR
jgi:hypothetical protein